MSKVKKPKKPPKDPPSGTVDVRHVPVTCIFLCATDVPALKKGQQLRVTHYADGLMHIEPGAMPIVGTPEQRLAALERDIKQLGDLLTGAANTLRDLEARLRPAG